MVETRIKPVYRMSHIGHCPRAQGAERLGYETAELPKYLETAAEEGRWHEARIKEELVAGGCIVADEQKEFIIEFPTFNMVGHIDGTVTTPGEPTRLLEIKSMSQYEFDRWCRDKFVGFPWYRSQLACYMKASKLHEALYIVKNRNTGSKWVEVVCGHVALFDSIVNTIEAVERNALEGKLISAEYQPANVECRRCAYKHLCLDTSTVDLSSIDEATMRNLAAQWREGKKLQDKAFAMMEEAKSQFKTQMVTSKLNSWNFDGLAVKHVVTRASAYYDTKTLQEMFSVEQLAPAVRERKGSDYIRIDDTREV